MRRITKDWVDAYFEYGVDKERRRIFLVGGIDEDLIGYAMKGIYFLEGENLEKPINLYISSFGGSEYEMLGLYDVINTVACPIITMGVGKVMSAAPLLVAAGEPGERWCGPNTTFMVHQSWDHFAGRIDELKILAKHYDTLSDTWCNLMARHTNQSAEDWRTIL